MQDRYAGDVGDFGKLGMLRCMEDFGLRVGINWYLVDDESHNNDGKHIGYLEDEKYRGCDDELLGSLNSMAVHGKRSVIGIEQLSLLSTQKYYHERIFEPKIQTTESRSGWHQKGLEAMSDCDLVFLDPDNGMLPKSVSRASNKSIKYVLPEEIMDYYDAGHSVVFYSHRTRESLDVYLERFEELFECAEGKGAKIKGLTFKRGTLRDYFFVLHEEHENQVQNGIDKIMTSKWSQHFEIVRISNKNVMVNSVLTFFAKVGEVVTEMLEAAKRVAQSEDVKMFFKGLLGLQDIINLGAKNNWVVILPGIDLGISGKTQEEIDKYFINYIEQDNEIYETIKKRIVSSTLLKEKNNLLYQVFDAIELGHYALAGIALSSTIEYMLALDVGYDRYKIQRMIDDFKNNVDKISISEEGLLPAFGLEGFLTNFSLETKGFGKEKQPQFVNRHWCAHGRMHSDLTKIDVYQMLCAIYALDVVIEAEQRALSSSEE